MNDPLINNKDLHFKGQHSDEVVIAFFRSHWITLVPLFIIYTFFMATTLILLMSFANQIIYFFSTSIGKIALILCIFLLTYFIHHFFIRLINHFLSYVIITNLRIVEIQKIIFVKDLQFSHNLKMIQDIEKEQNGLLKNILSFGELIIKMSSSEIRTLSFVPNPNFHFRLLNRLRLENIASPDHKKII
jgi:hypothetical protein